ncbi:hypothetical protein SODALDRAFT_326924 [Sodiomyces alkalinus F11]|uniref:Sin3-associated polypeptide Sap18 n=1 Tax=Sodiomyces alkalinus (strain CBS 110278 / VKM F-3762 / F11) TaxID=1314773 RepID=A0A3N2Q7V5_SODAK|nr:hypothetical protein SODALDRAFT_326924 [Sodiomyces alkalinus F11]ROT42767.1 hypothetical protein SODALDRAFT_326924 [Sodiomyces alkalinus F11]
MATPPIDRHEATPFLLRLFYREGSFHRPEEFAARPLPPSLPLYAWHDCTLNELALQVAAERPSLLPTPAIGTRLAFRLVIPDTRAGAGAASSDPHHRHAPPRFMVKDLGSIVIGGDVPGVANGFDTVDAEELVGVARRPPSPIGEKAKTGGSAGDTTLQSAKFVIGDYISCAILPPLPDGSIAPEPSAWEAPLTRNARGLGDSGPYARGGRRDIGFGRARRDRGRSGLGSFVPEGEWRRGERVPGQAPDRSWGGRRGRGR